MDEAKRDEMSGGGEAIERLIADLGWADDRMFAIQYQGNAYVHALVYQLAQMRTLVAAVARIVVDDNISSTEACRHIAGMAGVRAIFDASTADS